MSTSATNRYMVHLLQSLQLVNGDKDLAGPLADVFFSIDFVGEDIDVVLPPGVRAGIVDGLWKYLEEKVRLDEVRRNYPQPEWLRPEGFKIAVAGESGSGKSSLVNTLRGLHNNHALAAPTGVTETTQNPKSYALDNSLLHINLWDLPGGGTLNFPPKDYMQKMGLRHFDLVIVVTKGRFTEFDDELRKEMLRQNPPVPYLMVRTNVDIDVQNNDDDGISEEKTLKSIRAEFGKLYPSDLENGNFFLVNAKRRDRWDFPAVEEKMIETVKPFGLAEETKTAWTTGLSAGV